jgi:hypothetical protein
MKSFFTLLMVVVMSAYAQFNFTDIAFMAPPAAGGPPPCTSYAIDDVTSFTAAEVIDNVDGFYPQNSSLFTFTIYAYENTGVGANRVYSTNGLASSFTDSGGTDNFYVQLTWTDVAGADGYRVVAYDPEASYQDAYFDVPQGYGAVKIGFSQPATFVDTPVNGYYTFATPVVTPSYRCE